MAHTDPKELADLPQFFDESGDRYRDQRLVAQTESQRAYFYGRMDQCYAAAGMVRGLLGSFADRTLDDHTDHLCDASCPSDTRDEEAAAIERLDRHRHAGDTAVLMAGR